MDWLYVILLYMGLFPTLTPYRLTRMSEPIHNGAPPPALMTAIRRILRPLVRGFIGFGVTWPLLADILKRTYVDIARDEFGLKPDKPPTDSRISLVTRVHRKDIRRFRLETEPPKLDLADSSVGAQIIARWCADAQYLDEAQNPKPLARTGTGGFEHLARSVSKDTHPRAILDELVRGSLARIDADDFVHLDMNAFIPKADFENLAWYYGLNLHDHIAASTHNITGGTPAFLDRCVHYTHLDDASIAELEALSRQLAMDALLALNTRASALEARNKDRPEATKRMTFGTYFYAGENTTDADGGFEDA